jgi:hypothetical protein
MPARRRVDINGFTVNPVRCATCPFNPNGSPDIRHAITATLLEVSHVCHHPPSNKRICRGARDLQIQLMHAAGYLTTPDDAGWQAASEQTP